MAKRLRLLRGLEANVPVLLEGELGYTTDTKKLYIGSSTGNIELGKAQDLLSAIAAKADKSNVLEKDNTTSFTPSANYHPATKKFVDDAVAAISMVASAIAVTPAGNLTSTNVQAALQELQTDADNLDAAKSDKSNVLEKDNTSAFTPSADYHPATKKFVDDALNTLIDSAPGTLDTLNEIAAALGDDPNFAATLTTQIASKLDTATFNAHNTDTTKHITASERTTWNNKVDQVAGKGLSENDYTDAEKAKLAGLSNYDDSSLDGRVTALESGYDCGDFASIS